MDEPIRTWLNTRTAQATMQTHINRAINTATNQPTARDHRVYVPSAAELRGIPAVGRDTGGGHIPGTHPERQATR